MRGVTALGPPRSRGVTASCEPAVVYWGPPLLLLVTLLLFPVVLRLTVVLRLPRADLFGRGTKKSCAFSMACESGAWSELGTLLSDAPGFDELFSPTTQLGALSAIRRGGIAVKAGSVTLADAGA
jgi:hypothetical protein